MTVIEPISSPDAIQRNTLRLGILPFFTNSIKGFSIEEHTPEELWFSDSLEGPWEWKGPVICNMQCAYGKFFRNKAGYISLELLPHLVNYRRSLYPLQRFSALERLVYNTIVESESIRSDQLKVLTGFGPRKREKISADPIDRLLSSESFKAKCSMSEPSKSDLFNVQPLASEPSKSDLFSSDSKEKKPSSASFDTAISRLQMYGWIVCGDFEYSYTKEGKRYGWGKAVYVTPEAMYGDSFVLDAISSSVAPEESFRILLDQIAQRTTLQHTDLARILKA